MCPWFACALNFLCLQLSFRCACVSVPTTVFLLTKPWFGVAIAKLSMRCDQILKCFRLQCLLAALAIFEQLICWRKLTRIAWNASGDQRFFVNCWSWPSVTRYEKEKLHLSVSERNSSHWPRDMARHSQRQELWTTELSSQMRDFTGEVSRLSQVWKRSLDRGPSELNR